MSLGALGQYGSDSSASDSGQEDGAVPGKLLEGGSMACVDPLSLGRGGNVTDSTSDSDPSSQSSPATSPESTPPPALPLPDMDIIVAKNTSYSGSELYTSALSASKNRDTTDQSGGQVDQDRSSVFTNPYEQAEAAKLAMLKKHVEEFDKKPAARGPSPQPRSRKQHRKRRKSPFKSAGGESALFDDNDSSLSIKKERKHRCGVTNSLEPPKKYMKMYDRVYK